MQEDFRWFAKYPYDPRASNILSNISLNIEEFQKDDLRFLLEDSLNRIIELIKGKGKLIWDNDYQEMIKFYLSLLIVRDTANEMIYRIFSDAESKRAFKLLVNEEGDKIIDLGKALGLDMFKQGNKFFIRYTDFIENTKGLSPVHWKLFNFRVEKGYVQLSKRQVSRIISNLIKRKIFNMIASIEATPDFIREYSNKLLDNVEFRDRSRIEEVKEKNISYYPPCIKKIISEIPIGLSHPARFTLVTFLHKMGYSIDEIIDIFRTVPDFNFERTRYQVEHILGLRGSRIEYSVPSCRKIRSYGMCVPDELCKNIRHPLSYVKRKRKRFESK